MLNGYWIARASGLCLNCDPRAFWCIRHPLIWAWEDAAKTGCKNQQGMQTVIPSTQSATRMPQTEKDILASPNTVAHSLKLRLVVMTTLVRS